MPSTTAPGWASGCRRAGSESSSTSTTRSPRARTIGSLVRSDPPADDGAVIRNAILHLNNEQPMLADLFDLPEAHDLGLRCTNLRAMNGKRPVFVDDVASVFFFPYLHIRFVEIPPASLTGSDLTMPVPVAVGADTREASTDPLEDDLEIDEDFLRRIREV